MSTERRRRCSLPQQVEESSRKPVKKEADTKDGEFLGTGSTLLNLAFSERIDGGWPLGRISTMPGQSSAGKTILVLSTFCEAAIDSRFDDYELIYDDVERRCDFNLVRLFKPLVKRLKTPGGVLYSELGSSEDDPGISNSIQDLRNRMLMLKKKDQKFIYVADSLDSFTTEEELEKEMKRAIAAAKSSDAAAKIAGSFNAEKAKITGQILRMINGVVADSDSGFILTQQLRQKMNAGPFESPWTTSGGEAPYFYSHVRPFLIKAATHKELGRKIGNRCKIRMDKNSVTGKLRDVEFDIYYDLGIDDIGSMVEFLISEKHWKSGSWIEAPEFDLRENGKDKLIRAIEDNGLERRLRKLVQRVWDDIEEALKLNRKPRYE